MRGKGTKLGEGKGTKGIPKIIPFLGFLRLGFSPFLGFGIFAFGIISFRKSAWRQIKGTKSLITLGPNIQVEFDVAP